MTLKAQSLQDHYELKWQNGGGETILHITLHPDGYLTFWEEGTVRDQATGNLESYEGEQMEVPASQIDQFIEALLLIQIKRKTP